MATVTSVMAGPASGFGRRVGPDGLGDEDARRLHDRLGELGVEISALGYYPNPLSPDEHEAHVAREHLRRIIDAAARLGLPGVNTFIGADPQRPLEDNLARFRHVWPPLVEYAQQRGVRLGIENCPMMHNEQNWPSGTNLARSPEAWRRMFEHVPTPQFGLNYDPSHLVWQMMDYVRPVYDFGKRIFHVHAKDMRVERHVLDDRGVLALGWHTPKLPGLGDIDWARFVSALTDIGYDGPVCVEVEDPAFYGDLERRKQSLRLSRNVLRPLVV